MAINGGKIDYTIGFNVDKNGLKDLQAQLDSLMKTTPTELFNINPGVFKSATTEARSALYYIKNNLKSVQTAFNDAFDRCVSDLQRLAGKWHTTYQVVNLLIFVVFFLLLLSLNIVSGYLLLKM